jgi:hypothetical protein
MTLRSCNRLMYYNYLIEYWVKVNRDSIQISTRAALKFLAQIHLLLNPDDLLQQ